MSIIKDYLFFNEGNEAPRNYHTWVFLSVMSTLVGRKVWINRAPEGHKAYSMLFCNLYGCLVGSQGARKTTAKDVGYDLLREVGPDVPVSAESMSKEAITQFMAQDPQMRTFTDKNGVITEYRPMAFFVTELKNFLSINPVSMIDFLTTIYDRKFYDVITKNKGTDTIVNPYVVFLACETPEWIINRLKESIISGGFSRRCVYVYELERERRITFPGYNAEQEAALVRVKLHLKALRKVVGEFKWDPEARKFYDHWYQTLKMPDDPLMKGYYESKHDQVLKIAMLLALSEDLVNLILKVDHIKAALIFLDSIEPNMAKLSAGAGRNELAHPTVKLLEKLEQAGGLLPEKTLARLAQADMDPREIWSVFNHLTNTEQWKKFEKEETAPDGTKVKRIYFATLKWYENYKKGQK